MRLVDCSLAPKLYHLDVAVKEFHPETHKKLQEDREYSGLRQYMKAAFAHRAFKETKYPPEVVILIWGWGEARKCTEGKPCDV